MSKWITTCACGDKWAALEFLCHLKRYKAAGEHAKEVDEAIPKLIEILITEQLKDGGWNYARMQGTQAPFCTVYVVQGLLYAHGLGFKVPMEVFDKARAAIESSRYENLRLCLRRQSGQ